MVRSTRRSKLDIYPDDWKELPIPHIPKTEQAEFVRLVDAILAEHKQYGHPLPLAAAGRVAALEREIDEKVTALYGEPPEELVLPEAMTSSEE